MSKRKITALAPWFGSNRLLAAKVGEQLADRQHVTVLFGGGMSELAHLTARTIVVGDLHRHVINLANVLRDQVDGPRLIRDLRRLPFHEDILRHAQEQCQAFETVEPAPGKTWEGLWNYTAALNYFVCSWMGRSGVAGTDGEFRGKLSHRWDAGGGDSAGRFRSAVEALRDWRKIMPRCNFLVSDCFDLLAKVKDAPGCGVYSDSPFPDVGDDYRHKFTLEQHHQLAKRLAEFRHAKVVCRFYKHPLVEELYPTTHWRWLELAGGKTQTNAKAPEVLLVNGPPAAEVAA